MPSTPLPFGCAMLKAPKVFVLVGLANNGVVSLVVGLVVSASEVSELLELDFDRKT